MAQYIVKFHARLLINNCYKKVHICKKLLDKFSLNFVLNTTKSPFQLPLHKVHQLCLSTLNDVLGPLLPQVLLQQLVVVLPGPVRSQVGVVSGGWVRHRPDKIYVFTKINNS